MAQIALMKNAALLGAALPPNPNEAAGIEDQARAVLRYVFDRKPNGGISAILEDCRHCANCGADLRREKTPYCSTSCRETAAFVRQVRAALASGNIFERDRQIAFGQRLWSLLGGGLPLRRQLAPERAVQAAIKREHGKCQVCGAPATDIDHTGSG